MNKAALLCFAFTSLVSTPVQAQSSRPPTPIAALAEANAEARRRPDPANFTDATQIYDYAPGAIYEVYGAPGFISTVLLEPGETIVTVAAGDTTRWMVEQAIGGDVANARQYSHQHRARHRSAKLRHRSNRNEWSNLFRADRVALSRRRRQRARRRPCRIGDTELQLPHPHRARV
jgi:hypothetical protein